MRFWLAALCARAAARMETPCQQLLTDDARAAFPPAADGAPSCASVSDACGVEKGCVKPCRQGNATVAVKTMPLAGELDAYNARRETTAMLEAARYPGAMRMLRCVELKSRVLLVFELLYADLLDGRAQFRALPPERQNALFLDLAATLVAMHARNWTHGDLKPDNLMLVDEACSALRLVDFGLAAQEGRHLAGGTFIFAAPELSLQDYRAAQTKAMDVWMFGVTLIEVVEPDVLAFLRPLAATREAFIYRAPVHAQLMARVAALLTPANEDVRLALARWLAYAPELRPPMSEVAADLRAWGARLFALGSRGAAPARQSDAQPQRQRLFEWARALRKKGARKIAREGGTFSRLKTMLFGA